MGTKSKVLERGSTYLVVLEHVLLVREAVAVGDEGLSYARQRVRPFSAVNVLLEHAVAGQHAEYPLQILVGRAGRRRGANLGEDLGRGERAVGAVLPDGFWDVEAHGGV